MSVCVWGGGGGVGGVGGAKVLRLVVVDRVGEVMADLIKFKSNQSYYSQVIYKYNNIRSHSDASTIVLWQHNY